MKPIQIILYNLIQLLLIIISMPIWIPIALIHKKRKQTFFKRLGFQNIQKIQDKQSPIWVHALSVGEVLSALPLVETIHKQFPEEKIIFSASTLTGYHMAQKIRSCVTDIIYYPYDLLFSVRRMIDRVHPRLFILVESDIWPNFLTCLHQKKIPAALVNARLSPESFRGYRLLKYFMEPSLKTFSNICVQSEMQAERFQSFGIYSPQLSITGNVKYDQGLNRQSEDDSKQLLNELGITENTPVIIGGSTHEGEEIILSEVFSQLKATMSELKLIIAPRDPNRAKELKDLFLTNSLSTTTYSQKQFKDSDVLIVDQMGVLGKLYGLCTIAFVGGSMVPEGGHNPLEPAALSKPIIFGQDMHDFPEISKQLTERGAAIQVKDSTELLNTFQFFLNKPAAARRCGQRAKKFVNENQGAVERTLAAIKHNL